MTWRMIAPLLFGVIGVLILLQLGNWQLHRLAWKEAMLAEINGRLASAPVAIPTQPDPKADRFLPVTATGTIGPDQILVLSSLKEVGAGYRVIAPFETDGRRILLDRGFLRAEDKDQPHPAVTATITGNLHWPDEVDGYTPDPDAKTRLWFARDIPSLSAELGTEPVLVVLRSTSEDPVAIEPLPVDTAGIPNDHLQYAITWFLLAVVWAVMTAYLMFTLRRRASES